MILSWRVLARVRNDRDLQREAPLEEVHRIELMVNLQPDDVVNNLLGLESDSLVGISVRVPHCLLSGPYLVNTIK